MPASLTGLRYPHERVLLPRTKLAYVHLQNLLTDAKRDRSGRVFGYVAIWLPEELVILYMQEGELVNATHCDGRIFEAIPIADALAHVPHEPEFGETCFHEAADEQLACMYFSQTTAPEEWPAELVPHDPAALFPYLRALTWDGVVEIVLEGHVNYLVFRDGTVQGAFLSSPIRGTMLERVQHLFDSDRPHAPPWVRRWTVPPPIPVQAPPSLVTAYRELASQLVQQLVTYGRSSAPAIAEQARTQLLPRHPVLECFSIGHARPPRDPVADTATVTGAVAGWLSEVLWATADHDTVSPEVMLRDLTYDRRHMFQSAGFYEALPFQVEW